jgi:hypothetical protein
MLSFGDGFGFFEAANSVIGPGGVQIAIVGIRCELDTAERRLSGTSRTRHRTRHGPTVVVRLNFDLSCHDPRKFKLTHRVQPGLKANPSDNGSRSRLEHLLDNGAVQAWGVDE